MGYVYSTLSSNNVFTCYERQSQDPKEQRLPVVGIDPITKKPKSVMIKGGTGVYREHIQTPRGVATEVDEKDLEWLEKEKTFISHVESGHIKVERTKSVRDLEKAVADLQPKDGGAQLVESDFPKKGKDGKPLPTPKLNSLQET